MAKRKRYFDHHSICLVVGIEVVMCVKKVQHFIVAHKRRASAPEGRALVESRNDLVDSELFVMMLEC